jgi:hypothetical protein
MRAWDTQSFPNFPRAEISLTSLIKAIKPGALVKIQVAERDGEGYNFTFSINGKQVILLKLHVGAVEHLVSELEEVRAQYSVPSAHSRFHEWVLTT